MGGKVYNLFLRDNRLFLRRGVYDVPYKKLDTLPPLNENEQKLVETYYKLAEQIIDKYNKHYGIKEFDYPIIVGLIIAVKELDLKKLYQNYDVEYKNWDKDKFLSYLVNLGLDKISDKMFRKQYNLDPLNTFIYTYMVEYANTFVEYNLKKKPETSNLYEIIQARNKNNRGNHNIDVFLNEVDTSNIFPIEQKDDITEELENKIKAMINKKYKRSQEERKEIIYMDVIRGYNKNYLLRCTINGIFSVNENGERLDFNSNIDDEKLYQYLAMVSRQIRMFYGYKRKNKISLKQAGILLLDLVLNFCFSIKKFTKVEQQKIRKKVLTLTREMKRIDYRSFKNIFGELKTTSVLA